MNEETTENVESRIDEIIGEIFYRIEDIEATNTKIRETKIHCENRIRGNKEYIEEDLSELLRRVTTDEAYSIADEFYWEGYRCNGLAGIVRRCWKSLFNGVFVPRARTGIKCSDCGGNIYCASVDDLKRRVRHPEDRRCGKCVEAKSKARNAEYALEREKSEMRLQELVAMPYSEYLLTPEWQEKRKAALRNSYYRCQLCNNKGALHVHHRTYERKGNEFLKDLMVLCQTCHEKFHDIVPKEMENVNN